MGITVVNNESELSAWVAARNAQTTYTQDEFAEVPDGVTINLTADLNFTPTNAGAYIVAIRRASAALITGRYFTIYGGARPSISLRDYSNLTMSTAKARIMDLQLTRGTALAGAYRIGGGAQYERCIFDAGASPAGLFTDIAGGGKVIECLFIGSASVGRLIDNSDPVEFLRCGFISNGTTVAARSNYSGLKVIGCWDTGFTTNYEGTAAAGSGYNATSKGAFDGTGFGANGQTGLTSADFVSVTSGSEDYKRAPTSAKLGNTGTAIAGLTADAYGTSLPQGSANDIGPYEYPEAAAPVLSAPIANATGPTQATIGVTTDTAPTSTAISYQILPAATGAPSAATIVGAPDGTITTGSVGALTKPITGLTTNTAVKVHFAQGTTSNVVSSASFTPSTLAWSGTYPAQSGTAGAAFVHSGSVPSPTGGIGTKSYSATGLGASGLTMNSSTGQLQGTCGTAGTYTVTPTVVDQSTVGTSIPQTQSLASFTLTIAAPSAATAVTLTGPTTGAAGAASTNFTVGANGTITGTITVTPSAAGCTFTPSSVNISSGSPTATFTCTPAAAGAKSITLANNGGLSNPSAWTYTAGAALATSVSITLTTDGTTPAANLTGLKVAVFDQATPDLWAGHPPIYTTSAATTNGSGVLTCSIAGLTTLAPGALAGLVVSNSDGTLTQGAAQKGYVGPALVS